MKGDPPSSRIPITNAVFSLFSTTIPSAPTAKLCRDGKYGLDKSPSEAVGAIQDRANARAVAVE